MGNVLFTNVRIFDGSGAAPYPGEVLIQGNRIARIGRGSRSVARMTSCRRACRSAFAEDGTNPSASVIMRSGLVARRNHDLVAPSRAQTDKSQYPCRIPELAHASGRHGGRGQSRVAWKVSQLATSPDFSPVMNQRVRCSNEPWVKASGTT
jgi:hypothetical protein